jgi:stalled ribosome alternative rescue factor ArfA
MSRYKGITLEFIAMLKRKNLLEAKLFKRRYEKITKFLGGLPVQDQTMNPFKKTAPQSVFNEHLHDEKTSIPQNRELFDQVIKEAFSDIFVSLHEIKGSKQLLADELFRKIRERYI